MTARRRRRFKRPKHAAFDARAFKIEQKRKIAERCQAWEACGRAACRRAKACRNPAVACFDEQRDVIRDLIVDEAYADFRLAGITQDQLPDAWRA